MAVFEAREAAWTPVDGNDWAYVERLLPLWDSLSGSLVTYGRVFSVENYLGGSFFVVTIIVRVA